MVLGRHVELGSALQSVVNGFVLVKMAIFRLDQAHLLVSHLHKSFGTKAKVAIWRGNLRAWPFKDGRASAAAGARRS